MMKLGPLPVILFAIFLFAIFILMEWRGDWRLTSKLYWSVAGLDGNDTAYDYLSAPLEKALHFKRHICDDGVCLAQSDWRCGFTIDTSAFDRDKYVDWYEAFDECFTKLVRVVPVYTPLDKVRKICGRFLMQFEPVPSATPETCKVNGGEWGVKRTLWSDEQTLLEEAGIRK